MASFAIVNKFVRKCNKKSDVVREHQIQLKHCLIGLYNEVIDNIKGNEVDFSWCECIWDNCSVVDELGQTDKGKIEDLENQCKQKIQDTHPDGDYQHRLPTKVNSFTLFKGRDDTVKDGCTTTLVEFCVLCCLGLGAELKDKVHSSVAEIEDDRKNGLIDRAGCNEACNRCFKRKCGMDVKFNRYN